MKIMNRKRVERGVRLNFIKTFKDLKFSIVDRQVDVRELVARMCNWEDM